MKDKLERARRFAWWKQSGQLLSARDMRQFLQSQPTPKGLERKVLQPYYMIQEIDLEEGEDTTSEFHQEFESAQELYTEHTTPPASSVRRSLLLGGPRRTTTPGSAEDPLFLSSPEPEGAINNPPHKLREDAMEIVDTFQSFARFDLLAQEIREQREKQRRDQEWT